VSVHPPPHHHPSICSILTLSATLLLSPSPSSSSGPLFVLFVSFVTLSSQHPSQATLTHRQSCLGGSIRCPPLPYSLVSSIFKLSKLFSSFLIPSAQHPSQATLVCRLVASVEVLVASPPPGCTYDSSDPCRRLLQACLASLFIPALCISF